MELLFATDLSPDGCLVHAVSPGPSTSSVESTMPSATLHASSLQEDGRTLPQVAGMAAKTSKAARRQRTAIGRSHKKQCTADPTGAAAGAAKAAIVAAAAREDECDDDDCDDESSGAAGPAPGERKVPIKHSTVEKQRRDRINTLIDLLAEQVPPANSKYVGSQAAVRRPKHAVLSDTLTLLAKIRATLKEQEETLAQLTTLTALQTEQPPTARSGYANSFAHPAQQHQAATCAVQAQVQALSAPCPRPAKAARASAKAAGAARTTAATAIKAEQPAECCSVLLPAADALPCALHHAGMQLLSPAPAPADLLHPDITVLETAPGKFDVSIHCPSKLDLHADLCEGLTNLPVSIHHVTLSNTGCEAGLSHATLRVSSHDGSEVTSDQLHLALYMAVGWDCEHMPPLQLDGVLQDAAEPLVPMDMCWEGDGCESMVQPGPWGVGGPLHLHSSSSSASIDSWIDDM